MRTPPHSTISHQSIEYREQLPHARYQSHLLGLSSRQQALVEYLDMGIIVAGSDQSTHVKGVSDRGSTAPYLLLAAPLSGDLIEGRETDQDAQALAGELSQFGQLGEQSASEDRTDSEDALEQRLVLLNRGAGIVRAPPKSGRDNGCFLAVLTKP